MKNLRLKHPQNRRTQTLRGLAYGAWLLTVLVIAIPLGIWAFFPGTGLGPLRAGFIIGAAFLITGVLLRARSDPAFDPRHEAPVDDDLPGR